MVKGLVCKTSLLRVQIPSPPQRTLTPPTVGKVWVFLRKQVRLLFPLPYGLAAPRRRMCHRHRE